MAYLVTICLSFEIFSSLDFWAWCLRLLDLDKLRRSQIHRNTILYFHSSTVKHVWSKKEVGESSHTQGAVGNWNGLCKLNFNQNSRPYIVLKLPHNPYRNVCSLTLNACFWFAIGYTRTMLVCDGSFLAPTHFHAFGIMHTHFCFFKVALLILSMTACICQVHSAGSLPVKAIY